MCEVYGFCGSVPTKLNKYTDEFWLHSRVHQDGFGYYLADKNKLYVNPDCAMHYIKGLQKFNFVSKLALCHIRFKTHGPASIENCHPFIKYDNFGIRWSLIHNGYIDDSPAVEALGTLQIGETDSERILLSIIETVNYYYEHSWIENKNDFLNFMYAQIELTLHELSSLGKVNLIFTDSLTNNMYVYMNHPNTLFYLNTPTGVHISTTKLSNEKWLAVEPRKLHIFNNGKKLDY
jgi:glutamine amidotransferase